MKRLREILKLCIPCIVALIMLYIACYLVGVLATFFAKVFITGVKFIFVIGSLGGIAIIVAIVYLFLKCYKKQYKNSQKDTRK